MGETQQNLTAVTAAYGDNLAARGWGVSLRCNTTEVEFLRATGLEEHPPMDWTPDEATELLRQHGYAVTAQWTDIDHTGGEDPTWSALVEEEVEEELLDPEFGSDDCEYCYPR